MYNYIFLIIVIACLAVIGYIVFRKFPQLSNLDVESLPKEKVLRKKNEILSKRIGEHSKKTKEKLVQTFSPFKKSWGLLQLKFRVYVGKIERLLYHEQVIKKQKDNSEISNEEKQIKLENFIKEAENNFQLGNYEKAEELFIAAIKINVKSVAAYRGLGDAYLAKNSLEEARQTYDFLLQLEPNNDGVMVKMAEIAEDQGNIDEAISLYQRAVVANDSLSPRFYHLAELLLRIDHPTVAREAITQAVELEPQNPKYLDLMIETAILCQDKKLATEAYNSLRLVNPENQKLMVFRERIENI